MLKAIELTGRINEQGYIELDKPLMQLNGISVKIVLYADVNENIETQEITDDEWFKNTSDFIYKEYIADLPKELFPKRKSRPIIFS